MVVPWRGVALASVRWMVSARVASLPVSLGAHRTVCTAAAQVCTARAVGPKTEGKAWTMAMAAALAGATSAMAGTALCEKKATPACGIPGTTFERTLILVKPEGVARGLIHDIIGRWERRGFQLVGCKLMSPSLDLVEARMKFSALVPPRVQRL